MTTPPPDAQELLERGTEAAQASAQGTRRRFLFTWLGLGLLGLLTGIALWQAGRNADDIDANARALSEEAKKDAAVAQQSSDDVVSYLRGETGIPGVEGADGQDGTPGLPGSAGEPGEPGPRGEPGTAGEPGSDGPQGLTGMQGGQGLTGSSGSQGPAGAPGVEGERGQAGEEGARGAAGAAGVDGTPGAPGAAGTQGPQGPAGPAGPAGPPGPAGAANTTTTAATSSSDPTDTKNVQAFCPDGRVTGGGFAVVPADPGIIVSASTPIGTNGWQVTAVELSLPEDTPWQLFAFALCASAGAVPTT